MKTPTFSPRRIMELRATMEHQRKYEYGDRGFIARKFERVMDRLRGVETSINTSTFGRVFRLGGSGHVCRHHRRRFPPLTSSGADELR